MRQTSRSNISYHQEPNSTKGYGYQKIFPNATASRYANARLINAHDSCLKTDSLRSLVHKDTLPLTPPRSDFREMGKLQGLFQTSAALAGQAEMPYIYTWTNIHLVKDEAPSHMVGPSTWKFVTNLSHSLRSC